MSAGARRPARWRMSPGGAGLTILSALVLWYYAGRPLYHTDLWGHLAYGRWIATHRQLPLHEPFMPLANDAAIIDTAWLAQLLGFTAWKMVGLPGLRWLFGACVAACCGMLAWTVRRRTKSCVVAGIALCGFAGLQWFQVVRPQILGLMCFLFLQALLSARVPRAFVIRAVPILFAFWANLHGSFAAGLVLLAARATGRMIDAGWNTRTWCGVLHDRRTRRLWALTVIASLAAMVNPYGPRLLVEVFTFGENPNLQDIIEWLPLDFGSKQGMLHVVLLLLWGIGGSTALTGRRVLPATASLPIVIFSAAAMGASARMLVWCWPLALAQVGDEIAFIARRWSRRRARAFPQPSWKWTALTAAFVVAAMADTPPMWALRQSENEILRESVSPETPVAAVEWLNAHPPTGQVFNTYAWGDYLAWAGPAEHGPFVTSQVQWIPSAVWRDYRAISQGARGSLERLEAYEVETVLIDREANAALAARLKADPRWNEAYEDPLAVVFRRRSRAR